LDFDSAGSLKQSGDIHVTTRTHYQDLSDRGLNPFLLEMVALVLQIFITKHRFTFKKKTKTKNKKLPAF
jgi:hypothetical protein